MPEKKVRYERERVTFILAADGLKRLRNYDMELSGYDLFKAADSLWPRPVYLKFFGSEPGRQDYLRKMGGFVELAVELDEQSGVDQQG